MNPLDLIVKTVTSPFQGIRFPNFGQVQVQYHPPRTTTATNYRPPVPQKTTYQQLVDLNPTMYAPMKLTEEQAQYYLMREKQHQEKENAKDAGEQYVDQMWNNRHAQASQMASDFVNENQAFEQWKRQQDAYRNIPPPQATLRFN